MNLNDLFNEEKVRLDPKCWKGKKIGNPKTKVKGGVRVNNCVPAESLNEFAPDDGGAAGRWYNDSDIAAIVGDGWYEEMDVSGDVPKRWMLQQAQEWLEDNGYNVRVRDCKINDDDMDWYIEGVLQRGVAEATGDEKFDTMMGRIQQEPKYPDPQMPPTDVKDLYQWAVKNNKPYHKIFAEWANREGFKSVAQALHKAGTLDSDALDYWTPDVWKTYWGEVRGIDSEMPPEWAKQRIPDELRDYLETVFDAYDHIVFDWPTEYRQIGQQGVAEGWKDNAAAAALVAAPIIGGIGVAQLAPPTYVDGVRYEMAYKVPDNAQQTVDDKGHKVYVWTEKSSGIKSGGQRTHRLYRPVEEVKEQGVAEQQELDEKWTEKYKRSIDCGHPKGFSQRAHCAGRKKNEDVAETRRGQIPMSNLKPGETDNYEPEDIEGYSKLPQYQQGYQAQQKAGKTAIQQSPFTFGSDQDWAYRRGAFDAQQAEMFANFGKLRPLTTEAGEQQKGADYRDPKEVDYDDEYDAMVARVKKLAGLGPLKTVYDPTKRVYRNIPTAVQPKK